MSREILYLTSSVGLGSYALLAAAETYQLHRHGQHLTSLPAGALSLWAAALAILPAWKLFRAYQYEAGMRRHGCRPAVSYPHGDPLLGTDWMRGLAASLRNHAFVEYVSEAFAKAGNTFWVNTLGEPILMTIEPENLKAIHATNFADWPIEGPRKLTIQLSIGPHSIFASNGKQWQEARAMIRPSFVRDQVSDLVCFDRHVSNFLAKLPRDGSPVDIQIPLFMMTMDSSTDFMFGHSSNVLTHPTKEETEFIQAFEYGLLGAGNKARLGWLGSFTRDEKLDWAVRTANNFVSNYINQMLSEEKTPERKYVFLNEIVQSGASGDKLTASVLSMILGGRDTTAATLGSLFWHLARSPNVVEKLKREVDELGGEKPTWEQLKNMQYLNWCIKEGLRLYPVVATNSRQANKDTVLPVGGGPDGKSPVFMPKGTVCRWSSWTIHRRQDLFGPDADEFRPERWEDLRPGWDYLPFGGGPRVCIGQQFAVTQMCYFLTRMFQTFKAVEPRDDRPPKVRLGATISLLNGCMVSLTPIDA